MARPPSSERSIHRHANDLDADHVAGADAALDGQRDLGPILLADDFFQLVLGDVVRQLPALHVGRERSAGEGEDQNAGEAAHEISSNETITCGGGRNVTAPRY